MAVLVTVYRVEMGKSVRSGNKIRLLIVCCYVNIVMCYFLFYKGTLMKKNRPVFTVEKVRRLNQLMRENPGITAEDIPLSDEGRRVVRNFKPDMAAINAAFNKAMQGL